MQIPIREAMIGDFVHIYRERIKPFLSGEIGTPDLAVISIQDVELRQIIYNQQFGEGSGGAPEAWYKSAVAGLLCLLDEQRRMIPRRVSKMMEHVDTRVKKIDDALKDNSDYQLQTREVAGKPEGAR